MGVKQVSSCQENVLVSAKKMKNLVCAEWKCLGSKKIVGVEQRLGAKQRKCRRCQALVKLGAK